MASIGGTKLRLVRQMVAPIRGVQNQQVVSCAALSTGRAGGKKDGGQGGSQETRGAGWAAAGLLGVGAGFMFGAGPLLAEEDKKHFGKTKEDRVRLYSTADNIFEYFSSYQIVNDKGKKVTLMSARNFYNAMTPGSHIGEMVKGKSSYKQLEQSELNSKFLKNANKLPLKGGLLNKINDHGLLTYTDYHFLLMLMSTPQRYLDIIFHGFDVSADGNVEAKEFVYVLARVANLKGDPEELMKDAATSGLVRYLFDDDLSRIMTKEDFRKLQSDLIEDVLEMEFTRYADDISQNISEVDFCRHLLYSAEITQKKKDKMMKQVKSEFEGKSTGISFEHFKTFYNVLFGGADLERAMFFLDSDNKGVEREEFKKIADWVVGAKVDDHVVEVLYALLDEDGDRNLSTKEFNPVLFAWRHSRGFQNGSLSVTLGNMKF